MQETSTDDVSDVASQLSSVQLEKASVTPSTLKLPQLFNLTPNSGKGGNTQKRHALAPQTSQVDSLSERSSVGHILTNNGLDNPPQGLQFLCSYLFSEYVAL